MLIVQSGTVDQVVYFYAPPGLSSFTVRRKRGNNPSAAMTTPTVAEDAGAPGLYALLLDEDMDITSGKSTEIMAFYISAGGMTTQLVQIQLSTVASQLATIAGYIDTEVAAIKAKTDNLPNDPADASDIAGAFATVNATLATIAGYIDTEVGAIKAKTDSLTFTVANVLDVNIKYVIDAAIQEDGDAGTNWGAAP